jgi:hypothetical protein
MSFSRPLSIASSDATITGTASDSDPVSHSCSTSPEPNAASFERSELIDYEDYSNFSPAFTRDSFSLEEVHNLRLLIQDELSCFAKRATSAGDSNRIDRLRLYSRIDDLFSLVSR